MTRLRHALRRFGRDRHGGATVEFVVVFPVFVAIFLSSFEASMVLMRQLMLERALDLTMREVRLSPERTFPQAILRRSICERARILPGCDASLVVEITAIDRTTYAMPASNAACVDRGGAAVPAGDIVSGVADQPMLVRVCYAVAPFFPTSLLGAELAKGGANAGEFSLVAASAFAQEPGTASAGGPSS